LVLTALAKYHAVSYCMISEMGTEKFLQQYPVTEETLFNHPDGAQIFQGGIQLCGKIIKVNKFFRKSVAALDFNIKHVFL